MSKQIAEEKAKDMLVKFVDGYRLYALASKKGDILEVGQVGGDVIAELTNIVAEHQQMLEALEVLYEHHYHLGNCASWTPEGKCNCGMDKAKAALEAARKE